jgi:hypothetical protein
MMRNYGGRRRPTRRMDIEPEDLHTGSPVPTTNERLIEEWLNLQAYQPVTYDTVELPATTARTDVEIGMVGNFIAVISENSPVTFHIKLNSTDRKGLPLRRTDPIEAPFFRFYISNVAGPGSITIFVGRDVKIGPQKHGIEELAARTGSIVTHDRRGEVIYTDDFESSLLKWETGTSGTGASAALSTAAARNGGQSVLLTGGSDTGLSAEIIKYWPLPIPTKLGTSIGIARGATNFDHITIRTLIEDGTNTLEFAIRYSLTDLELLYLNSSNAYVAFATDVRLQERSNLFHSFKLVTDKNSQMYVRAIVNETEYNLSAHAGRVQSAANPPEWQTLITLISTSGDNSTAYVDDFILTQNEP